MNVRDHHARRPYRVAKVSSRSDWMQLLKLASDCADDARGRGTEPHPDLRLATLGNRVNGASTSCFTPLGAASVDVASGFVKIAQAFARPATPASLRAQMATCVTGVSAFLDAQLHQLATDEFQRAHRGRPEVY